jgi:DNA (cytosine-5)-methyltransferase 1
VNVLDLFSGIGGMALGLERAGFRSVAFCELNEYRRGVLRRHWPLVPCHADIRELRARDVPQFELIAGGPPCQRTSLAAAIQGKRTGETLWPEMARLIEEGRPEYALIEQPPGNSRWEAQVASDLASLGYHSRRFKRQACDSGAPHIRRRVFIIAHALLERCDQVARRAESSSVESKPWPAPPRGAWLSAGPRDHRVDDGLSSWVDRIAALGDSVFPGDSEAIGRAIMSAEQQDHDFHDFLPVPGDPYHERCMCGLMREIESSACPPDPLVRQPDTSRDEHG